MREKWKDYIAKVEKKCGVVIRKANTTITAQVRESPGNYFAMANTGGSGSIWKAGSSVPG